MDNVVFPRKLLKRFILLYKDQPCLWDRSCIGYKHKQKRFEAISRLTELVQEYDPGATRVHVLRKIESLRACVRREYKRVVESRAKATCAEEIYTPHLWYYDLFSFIFGEDADVGNFKPSEGIASTSSPEHNAASDSEEECIIDTDGDDIEHSIDNYPPEYNVATTMIDVPSSSPVSKRYEFDDELNKNKRPRTEVDDEYDAIGINVAAKLRNLPPNMRILAEKLINDVLYQAQMNGLNSSTAIMTPDPFHSH